jgi:hypothetical protein
VRRVAQGRMRGEDASVASRGEIDPTISSQTPKPRSCAGGEIRNWLCNAGSRHRVLQSPGQRHSGQRRCVRAKRGGDCIDRVPGCNLREAYA